MVGLEDELKDLKNKKEETIKKLRGLQEEIIEYQGKIDNLEVLKRIGCPWPKLKGEYIKYIDIVNCKTQYFLSDSEARILPHKKVEFDLKDLYEVYDNGDFVYWKEFRKYVFTMNQVDDFEIINQETFKKSIKTKINEIIPKVKKK